MPPLEKSGISRRTITLLGGIGGGGIGTMLALGLALLGAAPRPAQNQAQSSTGAGPARRPDETPAFVPLGSPAHDPDTAPSQLPAQISPQNAPQPAAPAKAGWRRFVSIQDGKAPPLNDVLRNSAAPLLATLPAVRHRRWRRNDAEPTSVFQSKPHLVDVIDKPNAAFAKAIRAVRTALCADDASAPRRILVQALRPQAGASTLALNLALDAARAGLPAMLVDAGLGESSLTTVFAPDAQAGLHDVVTGAAGLVRAALQDEGTGLFFLPRTGRTDLVSTQQIAGDFMAKARRFGPIVIDGAAVGSDALTDRFADAVDDIVLVVAEGAVTAADLAQANAVLGRNAGKIRGFVVNAT